METCGAARVVRVMGARAEVVVERHEACGHCHSANLCGAFADRETLRFEVDNPAGAREGQSVEISSARSLGLRAAAVVYLLPAMLLVAGVAGGAAALHLSPVGSGLLGLGLLICSGFIARSYDRRAAKRREYRLIISRVLSPDPGTEPTGGKGWG